VIEFKEAVCRIPSAEHFAARDIHSTLPKKGKQIGKE